VTEPPRVVLFDSYPHLLGGAQQTLLSVASELSARGHPPTIVLPDDGVLAAQARARLLPVVIVPVPTALRRFGRTTTGRHRAAASASLPVAWARLGRAVADAHAEVVHVNDHRGALLMAPAARRRGVPVVWHAHSVDVPGAFIERTMGRAVAAVVAPSAAALAELRHLPSRTTTAVVPPPVDASLRALGPARCTRTGPIVTAARLHPAKGLDTAVRAVAQLAAAGRPAHLDLYGGPQEGAESYAHRLRDLVRELGVEDRVSFHGYVERPHERWLDAALYLQPSDAETFGMATAEAMVLGLPVVATRVGGLPELIDDGRTGILVPPRDAGAIVRAIGELLDDPARAKAMGAAAQRATANLTPARTVDALVEVWQQAVSR
jgi:glycosyltransferase involved in cell wall biosynthesis